MRHYILSGILALTLAACSSKPKAPVTPVAAQETLTEIASGGIVGFVEANGAYVWRGVPFAADTSGANRWRSPKPAPQWDGTKSMTAFGDVCAQIATPFTPIESFENWTLEGSEDCLKADIYAPSDAKGKSLPVMVWIHGGSNVSGASQLYQGHNLAVNEDVIIVSIQYRLGPLGWFSHPELIASAETEIDKAANFALLDQVAALEWVRDNISAFGGNPDNITIFGESAGGHNVAALLASPLSKGLFHKAIIQSGSFDSLSVADARGESGEQPNPFLKVAERLGVDKLHTASLEDVFDAFELDEGGFMNLPRMIEDGVSLPNGKMRDAFTRPEGFHNVPIISGINRDEMKLFYIFDERLTRRRFGRFIEARDQDVYDAASDYTSRIWRIRSVDQPLATMGAAGRDNLYAYQFDWDEGGKFAFMDLSKILGAAHSLEIPFVFNRFKLLGEADGLMFQKKTLDSRETLSRAMGAYWASFARDGVPTAPDGPDWPTFGESANVLHFDSVNDGGIHAEQGFDTKDRLIADLKADNRINAEQRCEIAKSLAFWFPEIVTQLQDLESCDMSDLMGKIDPL